MRLLALLLSFALVQGPLVRPQALPPSRDQLLALFGGYLETLRLQAGIPGLAGAILGDSDLLWQQAFGEQDIESIAQTRTDTPFHFAGLTQLVTASLVLRCVDLLAGRQGADERAYGIVGHVRGGRFPQFVRGRGGAFDDTDAVTEFAGVDHYPIPVPRDLRR